MIAGNSGDSDRGGPWKVMSPIDRAAIDLLMCATCLVFMIDASIPRYGTSGIGSCADGFVVDVVSASGGINVGGASCVVGTSTTWPGSTGCSPGVLKGNSGGLSNAGTSGTETLHSGTV